VINPDRSDARLIRPLSDGNMVKRGDIVRIETGGGGGWGHPFDREPERVAADVRNGFVSRRSAREDYGVVLTEDDFSLDEEGTAVERASRPKAGLFHRHSYCDVLD
jgi:N-methylhydantoinase B